MDSWHRAAMGLKEQCSGPATEAGCKQTMLGPMAGLGMIAEARAHLGSYRHEASGVCVAVAEPGDAHKAVVDAPHQERPPIAFLHGCVKGQSHTALAAALST